MGLPDFSQSHDLVEGKIFDRTLFYFCGFLHSALSQCYLVPFQLFCVHSHAIGLVSAGTLQWWPLKNLLFCIDISIYSKPDLSLKHV